MSPQSQILHFHLQAVKIAAGYNPKIETCVQDAINMMDSSREYILARLGVQS